MRVIKFLYAIHIFALLGCASASMVNLPGGTLSPYAPSNESSRPGVIKYSNEGSDDTIRARREDAYKQMYEACNSKYKILTEVPKSDDGVVIPVGNSAVFSSSEYWYITFQCE